MRILVVEDEHRIAGSIKKGLEQERYAVDVVYDGNQGFDLASTENYDAIILDLMLPGMDGNTLCRNLRNDQIHTPVIMLTARGQVEDKVRGLDIGADDYISKPFSFEELLARIRAVTRRCKATPGNELRINELIMDPKDFRVEMKGKQIILSKREFSILEYMMRNAGKVVSKDQIISHVWDYDADVLPNTVEVTVKNLRQKIDAKSKESYIKTIRGFGYKIG